MFIEMGKFNDELIAAGIMLDGAGLKASSNAKRLTFQGRKATVIDGPFAETKEQLLGFYVIDVENLEAALDVAKELSAANPTSVYEIRPIALYVPEARSNAPREMVRAY